MTKILYVIRHTLVPVAAIIYSAFITLAIVLFSNQSAAAQGCVALRSLGYTGGINVDQPNLNKNNWQLQVDFNYFRSFRHYIGTVQQKQRVAMHNNVINHAYNTDFTFIYGLNSRWSLEEIIPLIIFTRSQLIHGTDQREHTHSHGVGDIRFAANYWLLNPAKHFNGNLQLALGLKLPTGKDDVQDNFYSTSSDGKLIATPEPVDQSIQPGDGGLGFSIELNGYQKFARQLYGYGNFFYLFNPRETNGVPTNRSNPYEAIMSVPDQYMVRAGATYFIRQVHGLSVSLGGRMECIPVHDLIGGSEGFRRPGYVISAEPALSYMIKKSNFSLNVPVAFVRDRTQSVPDKEEQAATGKPTHGDAAFADFLINIGYTYSF